MNRECLATAVFFLSLLHAVPAAHSAEPPELTTAQGELLVREEYRLFDRGHFVLDGTVVDENGKSVPLVHIECRQSRTDEQLTELDAARRSLDMRRIVDVERKIFKEQKLSFKDGKFHLDVKNVEWNLFFLRFTAEGYYDTSLGIRKPLIDKEEASLTQAILNGVVLKEILIQKKFVIQMTRKGKPIKLERRTVELCLDKTGNRVGVSLARKKVELVKVPGKQERLPSPLIYFSAKRDSNGAFRIEPFHQDRAPFDSDVLTDVQLHVNGSREDGFVLFEVKERKTTRDEPISLSEEPLERQMRFAPAEGYRSMLEIPITEHLSVGGEVKPFAFYFRSNGLYGRGEYGSYTVSADQSKVSIKLRLEWQPDGSRNLETGE